MAKRNRKPNLPKETLARARAELYGDAAPPQAEETKSSSQSSVTRSGAKKSSIAPAAAVTVDDLRAEYIYVITDLRSMGILAAILFIGLVAVAALVI